MKVTIKQNEDRVVFKGVPREMAQILADMFLDYIECDEDNSIVIEREETDERKVEKVQIL